MSKYTWQGVVVIALIVSSAVLLAKFNMPDLAKILVSILVGMTALRTSLTKDDGDA